jgi:hypothetical protein
MSAILRPPAGHTHPDEWKEKQQLAACCLIVRGVHPIDPSYES